MSHDFYLGRDGQFAPRPAPEPERIEALFTLTPYEIEEVKKQSAASSIASRMTHEEVYDTLQHRKSKLNPDLHDLYERAYKILVAREIENMKTLTHIAETRGETVGPPREQLGRDLGRGLELD